MLSTAKTLVLSSWADNGIRKIERPSAEVVILGNGPSLKKTLAEKTEFLKGKDLMCVNFSVCSDYFSSLRPRYYIATDPVVFQNPEQCRRMFRTLAEKTQWELHLFLPYRYHKLEHWKEHIRGNENIRVHLINTTPVEGCDAICFPLYQKMLGMPRPRNVLTPALMSSLWMGYKTIYTAGVEHSWHNQLWVNDNNELMIDDNHFYDSNEPQTRRHGSFTMSSIFKSLYIAFGSYHTVERFSRSIGSRIYNITEGSFIDAFERKKI